MLADDVVLRVIQGSGLRFRFGVLWFSVSI